MAKPTKVDLTLLKRLVEELDLALKACEALKSSATADKVDYVVEMNKATGLASGVMTEAALLVGDIQYAVNGGSAASAKTDALEKLLGGLKGPGNAN